VYLKIGVEYRDNQRNGNKENERVRPIENTYSQRKQGDRRNMYPVIFRKDNDIA
jgi:hypothetical protein